MVSPAFNSGFVPPQSFPTRVTFRVLDMHMVVAAIDWSSFVFLNVGEMDIELGEKLLDAEPNETVCPAARVLLLLMLAGVAALPWH